MGDPGQKILVYVVLLTLLLGPVQSTEENDLWLLISSYEDVGITARDLAFFLVTHGYDAEPVKSYVTVTLSTGDKAYLTPNGAMPRLADMWLNPPDEPSGPRMVIPVDAIKTNATYVMTDNANFIKTVTRYVIFPVTPLGMCYDGSQQLEGTYKGFGYNVIYMYDPAGFDYQGHLWVVVEDDGNPDRWLAVDSYYGVITADDYYYTAPYSFVKFEYLDSINPKWRLV